jgi:hypothetical protein
MYVWRKEAHVKLNTLIKILGGKIIIYERIGEGDFKDLYKGSFSEIPINLLKRNVVVISAQEATPGFIDIEIK